MWNSLILKCPTEDICKYYIQEGQILQELPTLVSLLTSSAEILTQDHPVWTEIKIFQTIQEKYKRILRCDKCLQLLQRVGGCLRKMVLLNLSKTYLDLAEQFLSGLQSQSSPLMMPSCQQLEYVLLRTQGAAKLICEALHYSRKTFCYLIQRLRVGHLVLNLMMATSVTARVNILFRDLLLQIFDTYKKLYPWREKLKKGTSEWPKPLELPEDLEAWLNPEAADLLKPKQLPKGQLAFLSHFFEKQENGVKSIEAEDADTDDCIIVEETTQIPLQNLDVGEVIPRPNTSKQKKNGELTESQSLLLEKIKSVNGLKKLRNIWNNIDVGSQVLLKNVLTLHKMREIDEMFLIAKKKLKKIKQSNMSSNMKKQERIALTRSTGTRFAKHLGLLETRTEPSEKAPAISNLSIEELKPVKTFKGLKRLYQTLYQMLQSSQQYEMCAILSKKFKSRKADIKLLAQNGDKKIARKMILCTSKVFLTRFKKTE